MKNAALRLSALLLAVCLIAGIPLAQAADGYKYTYTYTLSDVEPFVKIGKAENRLVPVVINYLPDNPSWILVDQEEEEDD